MEFLSGKLARCAGCTENKECLSIKPELGHRTTNRSTNRTTNSLRGREGGRVQGVWGHPASSCAGKSVQKPAPATGQRVASANRGAELGVDGMAVCGAPRPRELERCGCTGCVRRQGKEPGAHAEKEQHPGAHCAQVLAGCYGWLTTGLLSRTIHSPLCGAHAQSCPWHCRCAHQACVADHALLR